MSFPRRSCIRGSSSTYKYFILIGLSLVCWTQAVEAEAATLFSPGSFVIPMDVTHQNMGMFKAYGLVYRLLQRGVPVRWAIKPGKAFGATDFSATTNDLRTGAANGAYNYSGGPFVIDAVDAPTALPIIQAWWLANANQPNVHSAVAGFSADVDIVLSRAPRIAVEQTNAAIAMGYLAAAGIPDDNGGPWTAASPNIFTQAKIVAGGLSDQSEGCGKRKWDVFVTPHNGGYSYSLTDPSNLGTRTYAELDKFVFYGGGWIALCHSILSNEDAIANLYRNSNATVRALFPSSQNSGFLTQTGFGANIVNKAGTYQFLIPSLAVGQAVATPGAIQALPGGSVQTWQSVVGGFATGVQYLPGVQRFGSFKNVTTLKEFDHAVSGVLHGGDGRGKVSFIGGHLDATTLPYSVNYESPYLRFFLNAIFFNGAARAHLTLTASVSSVKVGTPSAFSVSLKNTGASPATAVNSTAITLASGVTYTGMAAGPFPDCDPTGGVPSACSSGLLTWNRTPGLVANIPGGASGLVVNVAATYPVAVSLPVSPANVATMSAKYSGELGETFSGGDCVSIPVVAAPVPVITKTRVDDLGAPGSPADQYVAGNTVYWALAYSNAGAASLANAVVTDTLPAGFTVDAATTSPAPSVVVPQAGGTTLVKWNVGTLAGGSSGTITLGSAAPTIAVPTQTFTNNVVLSGFDAAGALLATGLASATATVVKPPIDPGKSVDKAVANPGDTLTYTISPIYSGAQLLTNATVTDPVPANTTYAAGSANAGGVLDTSVVPNAVTWFLGTNNPPVTGLTPPTGYALCTATATFDTVSGVLDTYVNKANPTGNFGSVNELLTRPANASNLKYTLLRFNLGAAIPVGSVIRSAQLRLTVKANRATNHSDEVRLLQTPWTEAGATWNTRDGSSPWAGGTFGPADYAASGYGAFIPRQNGKQYAVDIAAAVHGWVNAGVPNNGVVLVSTGTDGGDAKYYSDEEGTVARRPTLVVTYLQLVGPLTPPAVGCSGAPTTLTSSGDTYLIKATPAVNNGASNEIWTNPGTNNILPSTKHTVLQFDVSSIPPGATITSAFLKMNVKTARNNHVDQVRRITTAWAELAATWARRNPTTSWIAGNFGPSDYAATVYGTLTPNATGTTACPGLLCPDVTALVDDWVNKGFANNGIGLVSTGVDNGDAKYRSREDGAAANRPQLIVTWSAAPALGTQTTTKLSVSPLLLTGAGNVTITMTVSAAANIGVVTPPLNLAFVSGGSTIAKISGPTPAAAPVDAATAAVFTWVYSVTPGGAPDDTLYFLGKPVSSSLGAAFADAATPSVIVTPPLSFQAILANPLVPATTQQITNTAVFSDDTAVGSQLSQPAITTVLRPILALQKANSPAGVVNPGDVITYALTVKNEGVGAATAVVVSDVVPANATYWSCVSCSSAPAIGGVGTVTWTIPTLAPGASTVLTFQVRASTTVAASATPYSIINTATVSAAGVAALASNAVTNTLEAAPRLEVAKSNDVTSPTVAPGSTITYSLAIRNAGTLPATGVVATDPLPSGVAFVSCAGCATSPAPGATSGILTWNIGTLAAGASVSRTFVVTVSPGQIDGGAIVNGASASAVGLTVPAQSNVVSNAVTAPPRIAVVQTSSPAPGNVNPGDVITYTVTVTNNGPGYTSDAGLTAAIPVGTTYVPNSTKFASAVGALCAVDDTTPGIAPVLSSLAVFSPPAVCPAPGDPSGTDGGTLFTNPPIAPAVATIVYQVRVNDPIATGTVITNTAIAAVGASSAPCAPSPALVDPPYCITSNTLVHQVPAPTVALTVTKTAQAARPIYDLSTWPACSQFDSGGGQFMSVNCARFTVTVTNAGPHAASNFAIEEVLPPGLSNPQFNPSQGAVSGPSAGVYSWQVSGGWSVTEGPPALASGASATLEVTAVLCDAFGLSGPADTSCISATGTDNGQTNTVNLSVPEQVDLNQATPALRTSSATVHVLALTPATIRGVRIDAERGRVRFAVGAQTNTRGFHIWTAGKSGSKLSRLTDELIPAPSPTLTAPAVYEAQVRPFSGRKIFIEEVDVTGRTRMMGPFEPQDARLESAFDSVQLRLSATAQVARRSRAGRSVGSTSRPQGGETRRRSQRPPRVTRGSFARAQGIKIVTNQAGVVSVSRGQLAAAGLPQHVALSRLELTHLGEAVPVHVTGRRGGDEAIQFVALDLDTLYSGENAYVVSWGGQASQGRAPLTLPETAPPTGFTRVQQHSLYFGSAPREANPWVWDALTGDGAVWPYAGLSAANTFDLRGLVSGGSGSAPVRVSFWMIDTGTQEIEAWINGVPVGTLRKDGAGLVTLLGEVPMAALRPEGNALTVRYTAASGASAFACLRHLELGIPVDLAQVQGGVEEIRPYDPSLPVTRDTEYLILTSALFKAAAQRLANVKAAEGYVADVVDVDRVYDAYTGGVRDAEALRSYVADVYKNRRLTYVAVLGDDTFDPHEYFAPPPDGYVPSPYGWDGQFGRVASENGYADVDRDGHPDVAIGRLPASSVAEAELLVDKVARQETVLRANLGKNLFVTDNRGLADPDFAQMAAGAATLFPATAWARVDEGVAKARADLDAGWKRGAAIVHYFGHGGPELWADEAVLTSDEAALLEAPEAVVLHRACMSQFYQYLFGPSVGEALMLNPRGGAAASFGPSGITDIGLQHLLFDHLYSEMLSDPGLPLGEVIRRAKARAIAEDPGASAIVDGFNLLGDPALRLDGIARAVKRRSRPE